MSHGQEGKAAPRGRPEGVLDPRWEDALRAGQEADGNAGSVEDELAIVHLLRHAAGPEALDDQALDELWSDVAPAPTPWWKTLIRWRVAGPALAAAAAAVVIVVAWPTAPVPQVPAGDRTAMAEDTGSSADILAAQFDILAPAARAEIADGVADSRGALRTDLLALAAGDGKTAGGAP